MRSGRRRMVAILRRAGSSSARPDRALAMRSLVALDPWSRQQAATAYGLAELLVVRFVLICIPSRERCNSTIEGIASAEVGG